MKKLRLDGEDLRVETFSTMPLLRPSEGTVYGKDSFDTCLGLGCASHRGESCGCNITSMTCSNIHHTCQYTCNCGLTYTCATAGATDCPGETQCPPVSYDYTCYGSCTDQGCTGCGAIC
jgi:hypothetical protein